MAKPTPVARPAEITDSYGMPIHMYDPKSAGAESYMSLADEVIKHNRKKK